MTAITKAFVFFIPEFLWCSNLLCDMNYTTKAYVTRLLYNPQSQVIIYGVQKLLLQGSTTKKLRQFNL